MCFNKKGDISTLNGCSFKLMGTFTYLGSNVSSSESDINIRLAKALTAIDRLSIIWKCNLSDEIKHNFSEAAVVSVLLYGCTSWTLTKRIEKKPDGNGKKMLRSVSEWSWRPGFNPRSRHTKDFKNGT